MIGFLTGVAVNIVFGQIPDLVGADVSGPFALAKFWDLVTHPEPGSSRPRPRAAWPPWWPCSGCGRTRLAAYSSLIALIIPSVIVAVVGSTTVALVNDVGAIPQRPALAVPAAPLRPLGRAWCPGRSSVAALVLIQGAGVAESAPNPDGTRVRHEP